MALADSSRAIGAVTNLVAVRLEAATALNVTVGRPEPPQDGGAGNPRLNLFLYEAKLDPQLRNLPLDAGGRPPVWLALHYVITAFDEGGESDTVEALRLLGGGLRVLQAGALPVTGVTAEDQAALDAAPEPLRVHLVDAPPNLIGTLMQGPDDKYRFSVGFEVRPVMIAPGEPPDFGLLVGIDYTASPAAARADGGVGLDVQPTLGMRLDAATPSAFRAGDPAVRLDGRDLDGATAELGPVALPIVRDADGHLTIAPTTAALSGAAISAGSHPLAAVRTLAGGRRRSSNLLIVGVLPTLSSVTHVPAPGGDPNAVDELELGGRLLGTAQDDVFVGLYRDGRTVRAYDALAAVVGHPAQTRRRVALVAPALASGAYRVILRVNGRQARESPTVTIP